MQMMMPMSDVTRDDYALPLSMRCRPICRSMMFTPRLLMMMRTVDDDEQRLRRFLLSAPERLFTMPPAAMPRLRLC